MKIYPLTIGMTPAFYDEGHMLLRAQLKCLSQQTFKDFDVWLIDPHYDKRKEVIPEIAEHYGLNIVHVPYSPNTFIAKRLDCAIFNAVYCYSRAPRIVRLSCYRFVTPDFCEQIMNSPINVNIDFYSFNVGPCMMEEIERRSGNIVPHTKHEIVWNFESDEVHWEHIPQEPGCGMNGQWNGNESLSLARWTPEAEIKTGIIPFPVNAYGNIMFWRDNWLNINGTNEVFTNTDHWEDIDLDLRANISGQSAIRLPKIMFRLFHWHGGFSQRSNVEVDHPCFQQCDSCKHFLRYANSMSDRKDRWKMFEMREKIKELTLYRDENIWRCNKCNLTGAMWGWENGEADYTNNIKQHGLYRATILSDVKIGRNLRRLVGDMDRKSSLEDKVEIYNSSWSEDKYYEKDW